MSKKEFTKLQYPLCVEYIDDSRISVGSMDYVIIDKLYGAYAFRDVKIQCDTQRGGWVILVQKKLDSPKWEEVLFISEE